MNQAPPIERDEIKTAIIAPQINCTEEEAQQILTDLGMADLSRNGGPHSSDKGAPPGTMIALRDIMRLGKYVEGTGVVSLEHGRILITTQVMLRQMMRLEEVAAQTRADDWERHKDITYSMGYLGEKIGKMSQIGIRTKIMADVAKEEESKRKVVSWVPGTAIQANTVHVHGANQNAVADESPVE